MSDSRLGHVHGDEIAARDAVAVGEQEIVARGGIDCLVQDCRLAEAFVRLPDMADGKSRGATELLDKLTRVVSRTVIGDDELDRPGSLDGKTGQRVNQVDGAVVGRNDDRDGGLALGVHLDLLLHHEKRVSEGLGAHCECTAKPATAAFLLQFWFLHHRQEPSLRVLPGTCGVVAS